MNRGRTAWAIAAGALLAPIAAVYAVDYLPTNDGPQNAYGAFAHFHAGSPAFSRFYAPNQPLSAFGWSYLFGALEMVLGWREAYRLAVALAVTSWVAGAQSILRCLPSARAPLLLVASAGALQWAVYMGFFNWLLSAGLGLIGAGLVLRDDGRGRALGARHFMSIAGVAAAASVCHPFGGQLASAAALLHAALGPDHGGRQRRLVFAGGVALFPFVLSVLVWMGMADDDPTGALLGSQAYSAPWQERFQGFAWFYAAGPWWRWGPLLSIGAAGLVTSSIAVARRSTVTRNDRVLVALALLYLGLALSTPRHAALWYNFSPRFVPVAILLGTLALPVERWARASRGLSAVALLLCLSSNLWAASYHVRLQQRSQRWLAALGAADSPRGSLLPIVLDAALEPGQRQRFEVPFARPHVNTGMVYAMDRSAAAPYGWSTMPTVHMIRRAQGMPAAPSPPTFQDVLDRVADPALRVAEATRLASFGPAFDEVLVIGPEDVIETFLDLGYVAKHRSDRLLLARFEGCPTTLRLSGDAARDATFSISFGWGASLPVWWVDTFRPASWPAMVALPNASCGALWVQVTGDGGKLRCRGADRSGSLVANGGRTIDCTLEPSP